MHNSIRRSPILVMLIAAGLSFTGHANGLGEQTTHADEFLEGAHRVLEASMRTRSAIRPEEAKRGPAANDDEATHKEWEALQANDGVPIETWLQRADDLTQ